MPGPTEVRPEILDALRRPVIFHRSPQMEELMRRATTRLGKVFGTQRPVHVITGSGTGAMELVIRGGTMRRLLAVVNGDFGERFARMAEACGRSVVRLTCEPGSVVPLDQVRDALRKGGFDAVLATHNETATGAIADMAGIGAVVREQGDCLLLIDAVSSAGGAPIALDAWGADAVVSASQKALALPPGLAFAAVSDRLVGRAKTLENRGVYLDVLRYEEFTAKAQSPSTPAVSLLFALDRQLADIEVETLDARFARHVAMRDACVAWVERAEAAALGVSLVARPENRSPTVTCIRTKERVAVLQRMREQGYELGGGQAPLTHTSFRIGHMGDHTVAGVEAMLDVLERVLRTL
ncbi:MAG TPA: alanine--glyoxylate aminotransferase family protein [Gemmatimonadaceae bacterium]|nr:alanine--glyoxylate aminotransferase family protein [Gemmatimonadaceae bacterium]